MKTLRILFTICFGLVSASVMAQSRHYNSATLGMGAGGTAFADGYHANFINPANLMVNNTGRKPRTSIGLAGGLGFRVGGDFLNLSVYNEYLTKGLTIDGTVRENMLNDWFGTNQQNSREMSTSLGVIPLGFSTRGDKMAFSLATRVRVTEDLEVNKGLMELVFYGLDSDQFSGGVPVNFSSNTVSFAEVSLGFAMELPLPITGLVEAIPFVNGMKVYAGVAPKYLVGLQTARLDFNSTLTVDPITQANPSISHQFDYSLYSFGTLSEQLSAYADAKALNPDASFDDYVDYTGDDVGSVGSGFGLDMGVTAELDVSLPALGFLGNKQVLRLGMSVTDLGSVNYNKTPSRVFASDTFVFDGDIGNQKFGDYFDNLSDSLQNDVYGNFTAQEVSATKHKLPGMYNFGAALSLGKLTATLDYGFGFNNNGTNSKKSSVSTGLEYRLLNFIPIRVGYRVGGYSSASYSAGFGLDFRFFEFTFAAAQVANSTSNGTSATVAWSGLVIRF